MFRSFHTTAFAAVALLTVTSAAWAGGAGRQYAFLVACSRYEKAEFKSLPFTGNDIEVFRKALVATGFDPDHIFVLRDDRPDNQDRPLKRSIVERLAQILDGMRPQDTLVVALSGHGLQFKGDPVSYFVPVDGKATDKATLLPLNGKGGLYERLKACPAQKKLLIVNACRNDPTVSLDFASNQIPLVDEDRPDEVPEGVAAIYSCRAGQKSFYDPERKLAIFFDHVARAWKGEYSAGGPVTLETFFEQVTDKTKTDAIRTLNRSQVPMVMRDYKGQWVITTRALPVPKVPPPAVPPPTVPPPTVPIGQALFNGKDLTGWEPVGSGSWSVEPGGILASDGTGVGWLASREVYTDFELELEYRLPPRGNSGIFVRAFKSGITSGSDFTEVQLIDDAAYPKLRPDQLTGGLYGQVAPNPAPRPAAGQWHRVRVHTEGSHIGVTINDVRVMDADTERAGVAGLIGLQSMRTKVEFKNIRLRPLPSATRPLFNGRDLAGWSAVAGGKWSVSGGILSGDGSGKAIGWLATDAKYSDFELDLEYRVPPGGNSGVFLHAWKDGKGGPAWGTDFIEVQLQDDDAFPNSRPMQLTGGLYNRVAPSPALRPAAGQWHKVVIGVRGSHIHVTINGRRVVDAPVAFPQRTGHIGLQVNASGIEFRNIFIRELGK